MLSPRPSPAEPGPAVPASAWLPRLLLFRQLFCCGHEMLSKFGNARCRIGEHRMPALEAAIDQVLGSQDRKTGIQRPLKLRTCARSGPCSRRPSERRTDSGPAAPAFRTPDSAGRSYDFFLFESYAPPEKPPAGTGEWWTANPTMDPKSSRAALMQEASTAPAPGPGIPAKNGGRPARKTRGAA